MFRTEPTTPHPFHDYLMIKAQPVATSLSPHPAQIETDHRVAMLSVQVGHRQGLGRTRPDPEDSRRTDDGTTLVTTTTASRSVLSPAAYPACEDGVVDRVGRSLSVTTESATEQLSTQSPSLGVLGVNFVGLAYVVRGAQ
jgi:hypothetical protein